MSLANHFNEIIWLNTIRCIL